MEMGGWHRGRTERKASPTPAIYITAKLYKLAGYMECKRNKWYCKEGGVADVFMKGKFKMFTLTETEMLKEKRFGCQAQSLVLDRVPKMEGTRGSSTIDTSTIIQFRIDKVRYSYRQPR